MLQYLAWESGWFDRLAKSSVTSVFYFCFICTLIRVGLWYWNQQVKTAERTTGQAIGHVVQDLADAIIYAGILVFLLIRPFVLQTFMIPSESMEDTLKIGDVLIVDKWSYRRGDPKAGDIVVFKPPEHALQDTSKTPPGTDFVKRCIGAPGDIVEIKNRQLFRNGKAIGERYIKALTDSDVDRQMESTPGGNFSDVLDFKIVLGDDGTPIPMMSMGTAELYPSSFMPFPISGTTDASELASRPAAKIPAGYYLMVGDNRLQSFDGRFWGLVARRQIVGRAWFRVFPFGRIGGLYGK